MADTTSKYVDTQNENTEGMFDYPSTGDVVLTNSGQKSEMLVGGLKVQGSGAHTYNNLAVKSTTKAFYIKKSWWSWTIF